MPFKHDYAKLHFSSTMCQLGMHSHALFCFILCSNSIKTLHALKLNYLGGGGGGGHLVNKFDHLNLNHKFSFNVRTIKLKKAWLIRNVPLKSVQLLLVSENLSYLLLQITCV